MVETEAAENLEFKWGKKRGVGGKSKNIQFYESFVYDAVEYCLFDSVYIYGDDQPEPYIGKLIKIWENPDKSRKVKILWFFRPYEISNFLGDENSDENELFLACGEGLGAANVNPLEAIAGKCNVICTSSDNRNLKPSDEDLQSADFFFHRFFDVGQCEILTKINDQIAGHDVKFFFNKVGSSKPSFLKPDSIAKEGGEESGKSNGLLAKGKPSLGENLPSFADKHHAVVALTDKKGSVSDANTISELYMCAINANGIAQTSEVKGVNVKPSISVGGNSTSLLRDEFSEMKKFTEPGNTSSSKIDLGFVENSSNDESNVGNLVNCSLVDGKLVTTDDPNELDDRPLKQAKLEGLIKILDDKSKKSNGVVEARNFEDTQKLNGVVGRDDVTLEKFAEMKYDENAKRNSDEFLKNEKLNKVATNLDNSQGSNESFKKRKHHEKAMRLGFSFDSSNMLKLDKNDTHGAEDGPSKKLKPNEKIVEFGNAKLSKTSLRQASQKDEKSNNQGVNQTKEVDKSKWFKNLPWKERVESAHEQGRLVLLQNLDPLYTSADVEELVLQAFSESCTAKMIQQISFSSPHSGQAFVILRNKGVAETVVRKLDEGCLWLPNGMPLVGRFATPFLDRQFTFVGHLNLDKFRYQFQREMREAVSTSHCSQPNTLEYDMAMEWFHLQEVSDKEWKMLHEKQREELKRTRASMKAKGR